MRVFEYVCVCLLICVHYFELVYVFAYDCVCKLCWRIFVCLRSLRSSHMFAYVGVCLRVIVCLRMFAYICVYSRMFAYVCVSAGDLTRVVRQLVGQALVVVAVRGQHVRGGGGALAEGLQGGCLVVEVGLALRGACAQTTQGDQNSTYLFKIQV